VITAGRPDEEHPIDTDDGYPTRIAKTGPCWSGLPNRLLSVGPIA
jgi:hypothetical protein